MYTEEQKQRFSQILGGIAESLDIPRSMYDKAVSKYGAVGKWLDTNDSVLHVFKPTIYPQGSFRLGTMVKPINDGQEYDIDLVCHLGIAKDNVTQAELKEMVGNRLKDNKTYKEMLAKEGRRCWTLLYANEFHMDILPAIPNYEKPGESILITDKELRQWQHSNPIGYARWFTDRMGIIFEQRKVSPAESIRANVQDIPDYMVRTPLQRAVQLLKRHRDVHFSGKEHKPISIILTTLAARAYNNEADLYDAMINITTAMTVDRHIRNASGKYYIPNPTDLDENFADKWNQDELLPKAFFSWLTKLTTDLQSTIEQGESKRMVESLAPVFGPSPVWATLTPVRESGRVAKAHPYVPMRNPDKPWSC